MFGLIPQNGLEKKGYSLNEYVFSFGKTDRKTQRTCPEFS